MSPAINIYIVSGLPRSGTSLAMAVLGAAGIELLTDGVRKADEHNQRGYCEYEPVKNIRVDQSWVYSAKGKGIKVVSPLLQYLPQDLNYQIVFIRRNLDEIYASQNDMLAKRGKVVESELGREEWLSLMRRHLEEVECWMRSCSNINVSFIEYGRLVEKPGLICRELVESILPGADWSRMAAVVDPKLHRHRLENIRE